ncbi:hypothetical protein M153_20400012063 [Pseudoloma neurophilia]|uniref:Uncharacterized protein n=1 Tax=Pseudoloma neurophilia TaxID=146866 RepID=A0A0R0M677_9MICR|nr:hypothetical protein M153_20400012063 [Pseudoloma neurophilia]
MEEKNKIILGVVAAVISSGATVTETNEKGTTNKSNDGPGEPIPSANSLPNQSGQSPKAS